MDAKQIATVITIFNAITVNVLIHVYWEILVLETLNVLVMTTELLVNARLALTEIHSAIANVLNVNLIMTVQITECVSNSVVSTHVQVS